MEFIFVRTVREALDAEQRAHGDLLGAVAVPVQPRLADEQPQPAAERLARVRADLATLAEELDLPVENVITPEVVRHVLWRPPSSPDEASVDAALAEHGARPWQRRLATPILLAALSG